MVEVPKGQSVRFEAPAGDFEARWRGACACFGFEVRRGDTSVLQVLERTDEEGEAALVLTRGKAPAPAPIPKTAALYGCPHHPDVRAKEPGECPKCGMKLELLPAAPKTKPVREEHDHSH